MKKLAFLFGAIFLFAALSPTHAEDFFPGRIKIIVKHEYLPITPTPNARGIIETGIATLDSLNILYTVNDYEMPVDTSSEINKSFFFSSFRILST